MLYGLEEKISDFKRIVSEKKLSQSYLFFGDPQIGKFTFAGALVNFLETGEFVPPSKDKPLVDAEFFLPEESGNIGIETVRRFKQFIYQRPFSSSRRTAIFDSAQSLTPEAQNALLKIIEEPPQFALIIFIANEISVFPQTLVSRFAKVYFPRLSQKSLEKYLKENCKLNSSDLSLTAKQSFGRIGRAIQLLEDSSKKKNLADPESLPEYLEEQILFLRKNLLKNSSKLAWLLEREELIKRYNLNPKLQFKAISQKING